MKGYLEADTDLQVVADTADGVSGVALAVEFRPAVVISDLLLAKMSGLEVIRQIHEALPDTAIILYSIQDASTYQALAVQHGAARFVSKAAPLSQLLDAIHDVAG